VHKGIGKDHAKFSPVATASYRLVPHIRFLDDSKLTPELSQKIVDTCPMSVFKLDKNGSIIYLIFIVAAVCFCMQFQFIVFVEVQVDNALLCTKCRECTRDDLSEVVELSHYVSRFIGISPDSLFCFVICCKHFTFSSRCGKRWDYTIPPNLP
jgi:DNA-directed RNA polymerase alpha subunit